MDKSMESTMEQNEKQFRLFEDAVCMIGGDVRFKLERKLGEVTAYIGLSRSHQVAAEVSFDHKDESGDGEKMGRVLMTLSWAASEKAKKLLSEISGVVSKELPV